MIIWFIFGLFISILQCNSQLIDKSILLSTEILFLQLMRKAYSNLNYTTDKFTAHSYYKMYSSYLIPLREAAVRNNATVRVLEIGYG
jgi:hypothetical protein